MTSAPKTLIDLQAKLVKNLHTVNLGIVGDASHIQTGGYHIGAQSLRNNGMPNDYSLEFPPDRQATHDWSCAIDIGGTPALLNTLGTRLVHALKAQDPRVYRRVRGTNAPYDGVAIDRRYDCERMKFTTDDNTQPSSDRGHIHIEIYRTKILVQGVMDGLYDVLAGVPIAKPKPPAKPKPAPVSKPKPKPAPKQQIVTYTVKRNDTLDSIARAHGVKGGWKALQKLNNMKNPNIIFVGQKLRLT